MYRILSSLVSTAWSSCSFASSLVGGSKLLACSREWTGCAAGAVAFPANGNEGSSVLISLWNKIAKNSTFAECIAAKNYTGTPTLLIMVYLITYTVICNVWQLPEDLRQKVRFTNVNPFSVFHYSENKTLIIPSLKDSSELEIATDLAFQFQWRNLKHENMNITRLKGELHVDHGKHWLHSGNKPSKLNSSKRRPLLHWGTPDLETLLSILSKMGINASVEQGVGVEGSEKACKVHVHDPKKALIEMGETGTVISAVDENLASLIFEAIDSILDGI